MKLWKTMLGAIGAATIATSAMAADLPTIVAPPPPPMAAPAFDWSGRYFGVTVMTTFPLTGVLVTGHVGWNRVNGNRLTGLELEAGFGIPGGIVAHAQGRLGFLLGNRALLYGVAGLGFSGIPFVSYGAGVEFAVGNAASLFAEVGQWYGFGMGTSPILFSAGFNLHR